MKTLARTAVLAALLLGMAGAASAAAPEPGSKPSRSRAGLPINAVSLIEGSDESWSVSETGIGCYLLSPRRKKASRIAIGRSQEFGLGLFLVNVALSLPETSSVVTVALRTDDGQLDKNARMAGAGLVFVPLSKAEIDRALRTLTTDGRIWVVIRDTWISHEGLDVTGAAAAFHKQCDDSAGAPAPAPATTAPVGSKSATAP